MVKLLLGAVEGAFVAFVLLGFVVVYWTLLAEYTVWMLVGVAAWGGIGYGLYRAGRYRARPPSRGSIDR